MSQNHLWRMPLIALCFAIVGLLVIAPMTAAQPQPSTFPISQTLENVTLTINYIEVDARRIILNMSVGMTDMLGILRPASFTADASGLFALRLRESNGLFQFDNMPRYDFNGAQSEFTLYFDLPEGISLSNTVGLILEVVTTRPLYPQIPLEVRLRPMIALIRQTNWRSLDEAAVAASLLFANAGIEALLISGGVGRAVFSSILSFGTQVILPPESLAPPAPMIVPSEGIGVFTFTTEVPVQITDDSQPKQSVTDQGITVTLNRVFVTPNRLEIEFCAVLLPESVAYEPEVYLVISEGENGRVRNFNSDSPTFERGTACYVYSLNNLEAYTSELPETATFQIVAFDNYILSNAMYRQLAEAGADDDLIVNLQDNTINLTDAQGNYDQALVNRVKVEVGYRVEGNWSFPIDMTP